MKTEEKNCAFQYAHHRGWGIKIEENTDLITLSEAKQLYEKWLPSFKKAIEEQVSAEMAIWIEMKDETNYHKTFVHIHAEDYQYEDGYIVKVKKDYVDLDSLID